MARLVAISADVRARAGAAGSSQARSPRPPGDRGGDHQHQPATAQPSSRTPSGGWASFWVTSEIRQLQRPADRTRRTERRDHHVPHHLEQGPAGDRAGVEVQRPRDVHGEVRSDEHARATRPRRGSGARARRTAPGSVPGAEVASAPPATASRKARRVRSTNTRPSDHPGEAAGPGCRCDGPEVRRRTRRAPSTVASSIGSWLTPAAHQVVAGQEHGREQERDQRDEDRPAPAEEPHQQAQAGRAPTAANRTTISVAGRVKSSGPMPRVDPAQQGAGRHQVAVVGLEQVRPGVRSWSQRRAA